MLGHSWRLTAGEPRAYHISGETLAAPNGLARCFLQVTRAAKGARGARGCRPLPPQSRGRAARDSGFGQPGFLCSRLRQRIPRVRGGRRGRGRGEHLEESRCVRGWGRRIAGTDARV